MMAVNQIGFIWVNKLYWMWVNKLLQKKTGSSQEVHLLTTTGEYLTGRSACVSPFVLHPVAISIYTGSLIPVG